MPAVRTVSLALSSAVSITSACSEDGKGGGDATGAGGDGFQGGIDCNDGDAAIHPDAAEVSGAGSHRRCLSAKKETAARNWSDEPWVVEPVPL